MSFKKNGKVVFENAFNIDYISHIFNFQETNSNEKQNYNQDLQKYFSISLSAMARDFLEKKRK